MLTAKPGLHAWVPRGGIRGKGQPHRLCFKPTFVRQHDEPPEDHPRDRGHILCLHISHQDIDFVHVSQVWYVDGDCLLLERIS